MVAWNVFLSCVVVAMAAGAAGRALKGVPFRRQKAALQVLRALFWGAIIVMPAALLASIWMR